jgi:uncharacterized protein YkwD
MTGITRTIRPKLGRRFAAVLLAGTLSGTTLITMPQAAAATADGSYETAMATYTNAERAKRGIPKTTWSGCLDSFAESQARRMARNQSLRHQDLGPILRKCKLNRVGENIAVGYSSGKSVTAAWMRSPGHRANILNRNYKLHGHGAYRDGRGRWWVSHVFGRRA